MMMRILKTITTGIVAFALVLTAVFGFVFTYTQNHSGQHSAIYNLTPEDEQMIIEQYGNCHDIECLLLCVRDYAVANFEYDYDKSINLAGEIKKMLISSINTAKKNSK